MSDIGLARREFLYDRRAFTRDPQAVFFAVGLPLLYVVIFVSLFGNQTLDFVYDGQPGPLKAKTVMLAGFMAIGIVSAAFYNLSVALVQDRESGVLKRFRGTAVMTGGLVAVALLVLGRLAYSIPVPIAGLPALALALVVASAAFCCLGFAFTLVVRKAGAITPLGTGVTLALYFLSGNFFLVENPPLVLRLVGTFFPVKHLNRALLTPLNPNAHGLRIEGLDLAVLALWGVGGLLVALRFFRWTPSSEMSHRGADAEGARGAVPE